MKASSTKFWLLYPLLVAIALVAPSQASAKSAETLDHVPLAQLIEQLGDDQYRLRQLAETRLIERGAEAFTALQAAANHADLEIATRAKYILNQVRIDWVRPQDPTVVRSIMTSYGEQPLKARLAKVGQLSELDQEVGFGALCRVARFESSQRVARYAALAVLEKGLLPVARRNAAIQLLTEELGGEPDAKLESGTEAPRSWIAVYRDQLQTPERIDPRWLPLVDAELAAMQSEDLVEAPQQTNDTQALTLLRSYLEICHELNDAEAIFGGLQRRIELDSSSDETLSASLIDAMTWIIDRQQWDALVLLEDHYERLIQRQRLLLYHVAYARQQQGRSEEAEALAKESLQLEPTEARERNNVAEVLNELGRHDWSEGEWKRVIQEEAPTDFQSLRARESLALYRLHDRQEYQAAADVLTESIEAIESNSEIKAEYLDDDLRRDYLKRARSNREFFLACASREEGNTAKQCGHLEQAYRLDKTNADILIAMYRVEDPPEPFRRNSRQRLATAVKNLEKSIKQLASMKSRRSNVRVLLARQCNHYAWLVSNTEGDAAKAVERSKISLSLDPGNASYLDTLGRCYFAAGDLENAIKVQREAIAKHPHLLIMQRQLKQFEDALRERDQEEEVVEDDS